MNLPTHLILATAAVLAMLAPATASAHSLKDVQQELFDKEKYFQAKNEPAPEFALQDANGKPVRLQDFRGKVVVLHFIYAGCPDVCPLHAERIGEIQKMVNITPMKDRVQFISITTDPKRDTPDVLKGYGPTHGLDATTNWAFLTSGLDKPDDTTRKFPWPRLRPDEHGRLHQRADERECAAQGARAPFVLVAALVDVLKLSRMEHVHDL